MGFWDRLRAPFMGRAMASQQSVQSESQWNGLRLGGAPSVSGYTITETTALSQPATLQAIRILSGVFAMTPMIYFRREDAGRVRADDDRLYELMHDRPNPHQSAYAFRETMLADILLTGNFFAYVSRDFAARPVALTRLTPGHVNVFKVFNRNEGVTLFYDATLPDGSRERFPARDVWHVAGMSRDGYVGLNPLSYARNALGGAMATADHAHRFWARGGRPGTVLKTSGMVSPEIKTQIKNDWVSIFGRPDREDVAVLDQGLDVSFTQHANQESQFIETRQFQVIELAQIWGVPPHLLFDLTRATFSNIEHQSLEFIQFHLGPHYERVATAANRAFAAPGYYFEHLTDALVRGDLKSRMEAYWLQRQMGIVNANELRARENAGDIPGDAGTEYWRPANMARAGETFERPGTGAATGD